MQGARLIVMLTSPMVWLTVRKIAPKEPFLGKIVPEVGGWEAISRLASLESHLSPLLFTLRAYSAEKKEDGPILLQVCILVFFFKSAALMAGTIWQMCEQTLKYLVTHSFLST